MQKSKRFGLILSKPEKEIILQLAEIEGGLSQAALIRRLIRKAAFEYGLWSINVDKNVFVSSIKGEKREN